MGGTSSRGRALAGIYNSYKDEGLPGSRRGPLRASRGPREAPGEPPGPPGLWASALLQNNGLAKDIWEPSRWRCKSQMTELMKEVLHEEFIASTGLRYVQTQLLSEHTESSPGPLHRSPLGRPKLGVRRLCLYTGEPPDMVTLCGEAAQLADVFIQTRTKFWNKLRQRKQTLKAKAAPESAGSPTNKQNEEAPKSRVEVGEGMLGVRRPPARQLAEGSKTVREGPQPDKIKKRSRGGC